MAKTSVLVPVYGVEKYIERCANSLFAQSFNDLEYIIEDYDTHIGRGNLS